MNASSKQVDEQGNLRHLLTTEGLSSELLTRILDTADDFVSAADQSVKKVPLLRGRTVCNLFFEASTRTRTTFELAAKRLSADVINMDVSTSATTKGETLLDTLETLQAMQVDMFVIRHRDSGSAQFIADHAREGVAILNAGDGQHAHPTQALLDALTIRRHRPDFSKLTVAIVGDILHSRVARSEIHALKTLGVGELRVIAPTTLLPTGIADMGAIPFTDLQTGLDGVDVIIMLRLQRERMSGHFLPSASEFYQRFGLTQQALERAKPDALVMHPGPINRGVEIQSEVAYGDRSLILEQVTHGIAVRMAVMSMILGGRP